MKQVKVLHIASFNGNIGDNANHNGFKRNINKYITSDIEFHFTELEIREFYQSWNLKTMNNQEFINLANSYDLIIIGGGNFFELKWDYSHTGTTIDISIDTLRKIKTPIFFNAVGCDIAKGVSKDNVSKFEAFLNYVTSSDQFLVSFRNDGSFKVLKNLYGDRFLNKIFIIPDGGFSLKIDNEHSYPHFLDESKQWIGINIVTDMKEIRFNKEDGYENFIQSFSKVMIDFLIENDSYRLILFPHIYSDLSAINEFLQYIDDPVRRKKIVVAPYLTGFGSENYIFSLYEKCTLIMGMRFHSNVCAIAQTVPTIALNSYKKISDLYDELGLQECLVTVNEPGFSSELEEKLRWTLTHKEKALEKVKRVQQKIEKENELFFKVLKSWLQLKKVL